MIHPLHAGFFSDPIPKVQQSAQSSNKHNCWRDWSKKFLSNAQLRKRNWKIKKRRVFDLEGKVSDNATEEGKEIIVV